MSFHKDVTEVLDHVEGAHTLNECGRRHPDPAISGSVDVKDKERVGLGVIGAERRDMPISLLADGLARIGDDSIVAAMLKVRDEIGPDVLLGFAVVDDGEP